MRAVARGNTVVMRHAEPEAETQVVIAPQAAPQDVVVPMSERVTIMELREAMCRWPMGDPLTAEFRFCGARCTAGTAYCTYHSRIAYQPASDRRRDR
jgi:GcrA cell cycle regulator